MKRKDKLILILVILPVLALQTACGEKVSVHAGQRMEKKPASAFAAHDFRDEAVQDAVERYFDKTAAKLTEQDLKILAGFSFFTVDLIDSPEDIPMLFPELRYLDVSLGVDLDMAAFYAALAEMKNLKAVSVYCEKETLEPDFARDMPYVELTYGTALSASAENNLTSFSLLDSKFAEKQMTVPVMKYQRVIRGDKAFELFASDYLPDKDDPYGYVGERKVFVSEQGEKGWVNTAVLDFSGIYGDAVGNRLLLADVNFDGEDDILVDNGHFGNQGYVTYTCFLSDDGWYVRNESFAEIVNPSLDVTGKKVLSTWRNWAASHSWAMYELRDGDYIMTDRLTEELDAEASQKTADPPLENADAEGAVDIPSDEIWRYTIEKLTGAQMQETARYSTAELTKDQLDGLLYDESSEWGLREEKWNTLYNMGSMAGFSIYGSSRMNPMIYEIINADD